MSVMHGSCRAPFRVGRSWVTRHSATSQERLYIVGRIKDQIIMKGRTLHAHDIETCAESSCELLRPGCCAAFSINDTRSGKDADEQLVLFAEVPS